MDLQTSFSLLIKKAVGYVRVSTDMQVKDGHSLEAQKQNILDYCRYQKLDFERFYVDEGLSGKDMNRDNLQKMLDELVPNTVVIVTSISRISRSVKDTQIIVDTIKRKGSSLTILDLNVDTSTAMGDLMMNIMASISQFERVQTSERISATMQHMSRNGTLIKKPRFGYRIIKDENNKSSVVVDDDEQAIITIIANIISNDPSITNTEIARKLTAQGIKMRKSKQIYPNIIKKIIIDNNLR